jgi:hypothetical protein
MAALIDASTNFPLLFKFAFLTWIVRPLKGFFLP